MPRSLQIPSDVDNAILDIGGREVRVTNLRKIFWPEVGLTKGDLLQYYADVSAVLLPHIRDRAMVMKRYPHGASGEFFFMTTPPDAETPGVFNSPSSKFSRYEYVEITLKNGLSEYCRYGDGP